VRSKIGSILSLCLIAFLFQNCEAPESSDFASDAPTNKIDNPVIEEDEISDEFQLPDTSNWTQVLEQDFEANTLGVYDGTDLNRDFGSEAVSSNRGVTKGANAVPLAVSEVRTSIVTGFGNSKSLRVLLPKDIIGYDNTGASWHVPIPDSDESILTFMMRLSPNFQGKGGKIIGLKGGAGNTGGNAPDGFDGWSVRPNWWRRPNVETLTSYIYHVNLNQRPPYGDAFHWFCSDSSICTDGSVDISKMRGQWVGVSVYVKMNTIGSTDGQVTIFYNDQIMSDVRNLEFRKTSSFGIDTFSMNTFAGGSTQDYAPSEDIYIEFDQIEILSNLLK